MSYRLSLGALIAACHCAAVPAALAADRVKGTTSSSASQAALLKPVGITTAGPVFTPLIPAGRKLPVVVSQTFGNQTNGSAEVLVELSQQSAAGLETIASLRIKIPPAKNESLNITVTLTISDSKKMDVKTTVAETASVQKFGPFAVE